MADDKTIPMSTSIPIQGEILNGGNALSGHFYIKLWQDVHHPGPPRRTIKRAVVLKLEPSVLIETAPRGEFVHHLVEEKRE